jgi:mono/diheme cytochrome c family protein
MHGIATNFGRVALIVAVSGSAARAADVDFTRDVRPILSRHCFKCHGPDDKARKAGLRLDTPEAAVKPAESGIAAIIPGKPADSELVVRIDSTDPNEVMPPPHTKNPLTESQKQILKQWVAAGAEYKPHWAFVPPKQVPLPKVKHASWPRNPIDYFVLARLEREGLQPSPEADRYTLVRRLYLDLIGLPPTPADADAFMDDQSSDAYDKLVTKLLDSPHYGERWARRWLDLARYADTNGYEKDRPRSIWPYRDWVINALNADMPFDRFTVEQIAGDMLPNATLEQRIATGFHRNTMLNEEGGIDPLEFRFHAMTDRVGTTSTVWLGLTMACAQCHTHKYDPITQREFYSVMGFLNNADEPEMEIPVPEVTARRQKIEAEAAALEADLVHRFPPADDVIWHTPQFVSAASAGGATIEKQDDGSLRLSGMNPDTDTLTVVLESRMKGVSLLRIEALADAALPNKGPGRTPHGNFVLSEVAVSVAPLESDGSSESIKPIEAAADYSQDEFPARNAIDGDSKTGWAIHGPDPWNVNRTLTLTLERPVGFDAGTRWTVKLDEQHGTKHTLGKFRISLGQRQRIDDRPLDVRSGENLDQKFAAWQNLEAAHAARWSVLRPVEAVSDLPKLQLLDDGSILASGDQSKRDVYQLKFRPQQQGITALRLEVLPDDSLPKGGPGRVYYEGAPGDFHLSEFVVERAADKVAMSRASHSFASGGNSAAKAIDGIPHTAWTINGGQGRAHAAVFNLAEPLTADEFSISMIFEQYYAAGLGRFRIWATTDAKPAEARGLSPELEEILLVPAEQRTPEQRERLLRQFLATAPELAAEREKIRRLRESMPAYPTTLVMLERPADNPRPTFIHRRGEFLQPTDRVEPAMLAALNPLPSEVPRNRITFARWLVDPSNPLVGRVTMNRQWAALFGRGIVRTTEDFGFQGEPPTHPQLLDWLAVEFVKQGWSLKSMHRLIVSSATYRQSSRVTPELLERDPQNVLLARGPRFRLEAELLRDTVLKASGLFSPKVGGPSVFPPQPPGVSSEGAYRPLDWKVSEGPDRYRRGLYTFSKRTAPYAMFSTFDAPSGEACVARRDVSNTPLQALTVLNDMVFIEASQTLGRQTAEDSGSIEDRAARLFRKCLVRSPDSGELAALVEFFNTQHKRFIAKELDATAVAGSSDGDPAGRAAWTVTARALLNLDEFVTRD